MVRARSRAFSQLIQTIYSYDADVQKESQKRDRKSQRLFAKLFLFIYINNMVIWNAESVSEIIFYLK
jgi:hypothetical protein